jgi:hypothetical protein
MIAIVASFLIVAAFVGGTYFGYWVSLHTRTETKKEEEVNMDMARQWANIMSYDGTERGQLDYGEEDS